MRVKVCGICGEEQKRMMLFDEGAKEDAKEDAVNYDRGGVIRVAVMKECGVGWACSSAAAQ